MQFSNRTPVKTGKNNLFGKSDFEYFLSDNGFLVIEDLDQGNYSVTNDMNNVLASLVHHGYNLHELNVIYKDSAQVYDAILINPDNTLKGIASLNAATLSEAYTRYNNRYEGQDFKQHSPFNPC